jgi:4-amino-4-deoxy-L-arabinose transferase-like glycosyltransferase
MMSENFVHEHSLAAPPPTWKRPPTFYLAVLFVFWIAIYAASLTTPPLLDDADATHAQAAQAMLATGDWVTLHVDGVRYLEKAPLPYWLCAALLRIFGANSFAVHLPLAIEVLALALLGYAWARRAFNDRAAFYTALFTLTATGVFLFTRIFIPDALLSLLLCSALYCALRAMHDESAPHAYGFWILMALAVLTKGLVAIFFLLGTLIVYRIVGRQKNAIVKLKPLAGCALLFVIAAPWHVLAGLRNHGGAGGHGFFWFYFVNEHYLRFLGRRMPRDYNKLPAFIYWTQHLAWLFPWSLWTPAMMWVGYRKLVAMRSLSELDDDGTRLSRFALAAQRKSRASITFDTSAQQTVLLLGIFTAIVVLFFSTSTNQEYYTFPVYMPLLMLTAAALTIYEQAERVTLTLQRFVLASHIAFVLLGAFIAAALCIALWKSRMLSSTSNIGALLAHRDVGQYTLATSHFFDLTTLSLAALRLPASIAAAALLVGPLLAFMLRVRRLHTSSTTAIACTSAAFLIAAHLALVRFAPVLSSQNFAARIAQVDPHQRAEVLLYGDQSFGSSIPFYLQRQVVLVDGNTTSMSFGSTFADAPPVFITHRQLSATWGSGPMKLLFIPPEQRAQAMQWLPVSSVIVMQSAGKMLLADRPLDSLQ